MVGPFLPEPEKLAAVREALPATGAGIFLDAASHGPLPAEAARAMREVEDWELRLGRAGEVARGALVERADEARGVIAALVGGDPSAVALTHSAVDALQRACWAVDWSSGGRAVSSNTEAPDTLAALLGLRERLSVELALVDLNARTDDGGVLDAFDGAVSPDTRLVAIAHVSPLTGRRLPIGGIAEICHRRGALLLVDGSQAAGAIPVAVESLAADLYAVAGDTWPLGPVGTGALWIRPGLEAELLPAARAAAAYESLPPTAAGRLWSDARRFEGSALPSPSLVGLARSVGWLEMYVGLEWVHRRGAALAGRLAASLEQIPGVELLTPRGTMATIVTFRLAGWTCEQVEEELARGVFAILAALPELDAVRASVGFWNSEEELERFVEAVERLARHTPETLPRRPSLVVLSSEARASAFRPAEPGS